MPPQVQHAVDEQQRHFLPDRMPVPVSLIARARNRNHDITDDAIPPSRTCRERQDIGGPTVSQEPPVQPRDGSIINEGHLDLRLRRAPRGAHRRDPNLSEQAGGE